MTRRLFRPAIVEGLWWVAAAVSTSWALMALGRLDGMAVDWSRPLTSLGAAPLDMALAAVARLAGMGLLAWVGLSSVLYAAARLAGFRPGSVQWIAIGPVRRVVEAFLAGSLVMSTSIGAAAAGTEVTPSTPPGDVSAAYLPDPLRRREAIVSPPVTGTEEERTRDGSPSTVVVAPGDTLWALAEARLREALGSVPSEHEVAVYWAETVATNLDRLASDDPDLIFPGEEVRLPRVPFSRGS